MTSVAQSEIMTRDTPSELNRAFAATIHDLLTEDVRKAWPSTGSRNDWSVDFDAFFGFAVRKMLDALAPTSVRAR